MAALYRLCAVTLRRPFRAKTTRETIVSGFNFSIVGDADGLRTLFMRAVWGDESPAPARRFPELVAHRPERVRALHRALADLWTTERARYVTPAGDDYGDWFADNFEAVLDLYRDASDHGQWITNAPDLLDEAQAATPLSPLPMPPPATVGLAGLVALGALGVHAWRARRIAAMRATQLR